LTPNISGIRYDAGMTRDAATCSTLSLVLLALGVAGCPDPGASQCSHTVIPLAETLVTQTRSLDLLQTSGTMALVGLDNATVRWSLIDREGKLDSAEGFALPAHIAGPWFALTGVGGANNQMVAIYVAKKTDDPTVTQVMAIAQNAGGTLVAPREIFETVRGTKSDSLRVSVGSAPSGLRAMVAIGFANQDGADVTVFSLGENAQPIGMEESVAVATKWDCPFWSVGGRTQAPLNFSYVNKAAIPELVVHEMRESDGKLAPSVNLPSANIEKACPIVAPKEGGFVYAWRTDEEIRGADYLFASGTLGTDGQSYPLKNSVRFGGTVPPLEGVAGMGNNIAVLWVKPSGPEVALYDQMANPMGKELLLPASSGDKVGPVSTVSEKNAMFVTYRDTGAIPLRRLLKVTCPDK
jgi:hypothetical protein